MCMKHVFFGERVVPEQIAFATTDAVRSSAWIKNENGPGRKRDFSPVAWNHYFETMEDIEIANGASEDSFRIYKSGSDGPVLLLLHGGGHSALSWAVFTSMIISRVHCRVVAVDLRSHGDTKVKNSDDLSAETMSRDVGNIVEMLYGEDAPSVVLIGHSMGGAIAVHIAAKNLIPSLVGLCVIDVVEGTAMDALNSMQTFLRSRPKVFNSIESAIEWSVKSGQIRNIESAKVSMVGQVKLHEDDSNTPGGSHSVVDTAIHEEEEEEEEEEGTVKKEKEPESSQKIKESKAEYIWRIELSKTEKYWEGWFKGLSNLFLSCPIPKLLLLAGVDRLDRDLTIGQMQGKFQMQVLPQCGHAVHEDAPDKVAEAVATFMIRNKFTESKGEIQT
ncbi:protein phosphatase methylesterase 1 isoform X3 [Scyliorhinus canicula]|nr:protein phosphatase methylesterase 1 isoform X3 [Scyliorhinus canicula]XP_038675126.1 protein phosphatase methylesterase 1 isoform X3 [Scyliorhinus canicula]